MLKRKLINNITFYYNSEDYLSKEILNELYEFSISNEAEDKSYFIQIEKGEAIIY